MREALEKILPEARQFPDFELEHQFENIERKIMLLSAREIQQPARYEKTILLVIEYITQRRSADEQIRRANEDLKHFA